MIKKESALFLLLLSCSMQANDGSFLIDTIVVTVNGDPLCKSDFEVPQISKNGEHYTVQEAVTERLFVQEAARKQQLPSSADIDRQITALKIQQNLGAMSDKEFDLALRRDGLTLPLYKQELGRLLAVENNKRLEVSDRVVVTSQMVESYYHAHPKYTKNKYNLQRATLTEEEVKKLSDQKTIDSIAWKNIGWIQEENLRLELKNVTNLSVGQTTKPIKQEDETYQIFKLVDKQTKSLKSLEHRYAKIHKLLHQQEAELRSKEYLKTLWQKARINYLQKEDHKG